MMQVLSITHLTSWTMYLLASISSYVMVRPTMLSSSLSVRWLVCTVFWPVQRMILFAITFQRKSSTTKSRLNSSQCLKCNNRISVTTSWWTTPLPRHCSTIWNASLATVHKSFGLTRNLPIRYVTFHVSSRVFLTSNWWVVKEEVTITSHKKNWPRLSVTCNVLQVV